MTAVISFTQSQCQVPLSVSITQPIIIPHNPLLEGVSVLLEVISRLVHGSKTVLHVSSALTGTKQGSSPLKVPWGTVENAK